MKPPYASENDDTRITEELLRSFREDVAPVRAKRATLAALGLVGTTAGAATVSATAGAASAWTGAAKVGALAIVKAVAGGAVVGAMVVGTSSYLQSKKVDARPVVTSAFVPSIAPSRPSILPNTTVPSQADSAEALEGPPPRAAVVVRQDGATRAAPVVTPPMFEAPPAPAAPLGRPSSLAREIAMLDQARNALAAGDAREAMRILDAYAATVGRGALEPEATVLRIDALVHLSDMGAARKLADEFERAHPNDSHLSRVHSLIRGAL